MSFLARDKNETDFLGAYEDFIGDSPLTNAQRFMNFSLYATRQDLARFLFRNQMFTEILGVHGSIVECGVLYGQGLMTFAHLSSILEPANHTRRIIGFDTFAGFPSNHPKDKSEQTADATSVGAMAADSREELGRCARMFDLNRPGGHISKIELVEGDIVETAPDYVERNPHLVVSLLYLNVNLYEPTRAALETFLPRMSKGAVIAFGELNHPECPGETLAVLEKLDLRRLELVRVPYDTTRCYAKL
jgi:hypothetical protein